MAQNFREIIASTYRSPAPDMQTERAEFHAAIKQETKKGIVENNFIPFSSCAHNQPIYLLVSDPQRVSD